MSANLRLHRRGMLRCHDRRYGRSVRGSRRDMARCGSRRRLGSGLRLGRRRGIRRRQRGRRHGRHRGIVRARDRRREESPRRAPMRLPSRPRRWRTCVQREIKSCPSSPVKVTRPAIRIVGRNRDNPTRTYSTLVLWAQKGEHLVVDNRRAQHDYRLLRGTGRPVWFSPARRSSRCATTASLQQAYADVRNGEAWLVGPSRRAIARRSG